MSRDQNAAILRIGSFYVRHMVALGVTVAAPCILWTILYAALLLVALLSGGSEMGGLLAYPFGLLVFAVGSFAAGLILLLPATVFAEWIVARRKLPILAQIPISIASLGILCLVVTAIPASVSSDATFREVLGGFTTLFAVLLLPMGLYWWTAQSGPLLLAVIRRALAVFQRS